ncbi:MAG: hypothetical protein EXR59_04160, partial [Dehalococcoidia bacterium]|nr:hypothetical protein [Dehalococcoidia bacterium]
MRFSKALSLTSISLALAAALIGCGDSEKPTAKMPSGTSPTAVRPTATAAPVSTGTPVATAPAISTGSILDRFILVAPKEETNVRYGGSYVYSSSRMAGNTDTKFNNSTTLSREWRWVYEKLVGWVPNENDALSHLEPSIAENWKASTDLKTYTFTIRKGIKWQNVPPVNGREVLAQDAVTSLNRYREADATAQPNWVQVESIDAPDKSTVVIKLKEPNAWALYELFGALEAVVPPELIDKYKGATGGAIPNELIGTGPFIMKSYKFRIGADMVRNPDYWRKDSKGNTLPYLDAVSMKFIEDPATVAAAFRTGQLDHVENPMLSNESIVEIGKQIPNMRVMHNGILLNTGYAFNTKNKPWDDVNVRRAFNMSIDKQKYMAQTGRPGLDFVFHGALPTTYITDKPMTLADMGLYYQFNPTEAKKLLAAAGFTDGKMKVATPMTATAPVSAGALVLQELWKQQGLDVAIQPMSATEFGLFYYARSGKDISPTFKNTGDSGLNWY